MLDPRHRNKFQSASSMTDFVDAFVHDYTQGLRAVASDMLMAAVNAIEVAVDNGNRIYAMGNGGSTAIADHLCCDYTKGTDTEGHPPLAAQSFTANAPLLNALANDFGFEHVFSKQVEYYCRSDDVLIGISSSGNSQNIISAIEKAKEVGVTTIGMSGFSGGQLSKVADISLYVPVENYGVVEDCHQSIMHIIAQVIERRRAGKLGW